MHKLLVTFTLSVFAALSVTSLARSQNRVLGDPPMDYWVYGDVEFDPACMHWNWQQRSWYDDCTRSHHPLAWGPGGRRHHDDVVLRTKD